MSLAQYQVFNLIEDVKALKVLLILESPHTNEYIHQHPAAGESALELTRFLIAQGYLSCFDNQLPLGCNIKTLHYKPLAILNCSTLPMNKTFYPCTLSNNDLLQVNQLASIKQSLDQCNQLQVAIELSKELSETEVFKDFTSRLTQVLEQAAPKLIIVPCGDTATGFIEAFKAIYNKPLTVLDSLPHPTEPDWNQKINALELRGALNKAIPKHILP